MNSPLFDTPVEDVAVRLYVVFPPSVVGVPLIVHVPALRLSPFGSDGVMLQVAPVTAVRATDPVLYP